ncbi:MAG: PH domain-containing protein [Candidatus Pacebacteria bacterium]|nr:PH domain-containing protein [Candidatus Paceibacterota bacterium]
MGKDSINLHKIKKYSFPGQHHNEDIVLILRKHKLTLLGYALRLLALIFLPVIFYIFVIPIVFTAFLEDSYNKVFILFSIIYYGFVWILAFFIWIDYYLDIWIVTNQRLLNIEQIGFFNRVVSELDLKKIQDITSRVHGLFPTMFGFGNIHIQTAAKEHKFELKSIPHPITVRREIVKLYTHAKESDKFIFRDRDE